MLKNHVHVYISNRYYKRFLLLKLIIKIILYIVQYPVITFKNIRKITFIFTNLMQIIRSRNSIRIIYFTEQYS